jgi:hypothetical protein
MTKKKPELQVYGGGFVDYEKCRDLQNNEEILMPTTTNKPLGVHRKEEGDSKAKTSDLTAYEDTHDILLPFCMKSRLNSLKSPCNNKQAEPEVDDNIMLPNIN